MEASHHSRPLDVIDILVIAVDRSLLFLRGTTSRLSTLITSYRPHDYDLNAAQKPRIILALLVWSICLLLIDPNYFFGADSIETAEGENDAQNHPAAKQLLLPNVLYLGVQKSGTTSVSHWLFRNGVCQPAAFPGEPAYFNKEAHFFDRERPQRQGINFYVKRFDHCSSSGANLIMDATPETFLHPQRVFNLYARPDAASAMSTLKLIVTLREPVFRELSVYNHMLFWNSSDIVLNNSTIVPFEQYAQNVLRDKISNKPERSTGFYVDHIKKWVSLFGRNRILLLSYDELKENPSIFQRRVQEFLGISSTTHDISHMNTMDSPGKVRTVAPLARQVLGPVFRKKTDELYEYLNAHPGPPMEQNPFPRFRVY